jgi:hypothetical protein
MKDAKGHGSVAHQAGVNAIGWEPTVANGSYRQWIIPAHVWSKAEHDEDTLNIHHDAGKWWGYTERDQNVKRDLEPNEVEQARNEFKLRV